MKKTIERGTYGYINQRKKKQLTYAICCAVAVVFLVVLGLMIYHTKKNIIMVPALMMVIPMANFLVTYLALAQYDSGSKEQYQMLKAFEEQDMLLSDMVIVNDKGARMFMSFAIVYKNGVIGFGKGRKWTSGDMETVVNVVLRRRGIPMRLKMYSDWNEFLERIQGLEMPDEDSEKRITLAKEAILSLCL